MASSPLTNDIARPPSPHGSTDPSNQASPTNVSNSVLTRNPRFLALPQAAWLTAVSASMAINACGPGVAVLVITTTAVPCSASMPRNAD